MVEVYKTVERRDGRVGVPTLVGRDIEILGFILTMRFANVVQIAERFFRQVGVRSDRYVYRRLQLLKQAGWLAANKVFTEPKEYLTATKAAAELLRSSAPEFGDLPALNGIDFRNFEHDKRVVSARIWLENKKGAIGWVSERALRSTFKREIPVAFQRYLNPVSVPDGIFLTKGGDRVAFELEHAPKERSRYRDKLRRFRMIMDSDASKFLFSKVLFVCTSQRVFRLVEEESRVLDSSRTKVMMWEVGEAK